MKILIVYENIPESTDYYIEEVTEAEWKWMAKTCGHYINTVALDANKTAKAACNKLSTWLEGRTKLATKEPIDVAGLGVRYVLHTGFIL